MKRPAVSLLPALLRRQTLLLTATVLSAAITAASLFGCGDDASGTFTDKRDGKKYKTVVIGGQRWMAQNMNYRTFDISWCYDDADSNCAKYGRLYGWEAATDACPQKWHLPTRREWDNLGRAVGGRRKPKGNGAVNWLDMGKNLKSKTGWKYDDAGIGADGYGFSAQPGGYRDSYGVFISAGEGGGWWVSTGDGRDGAYYRYMSYDNGGVEEYDAGNISAVSVRCVLGDSDGNRNNPSDLNRRKQSKEDVIIHEKEKQRIEKLSTYFIDSRDGRKYRAVEIDGKRWMAENLNYHPRTANVLCYEYDDFFCDRYGGLYNWETAMEACPPGWHLPTIREWDNLAQAVGGVKGGTFEGDWEYAGKMLKSTSGWYDVPVKSGDGSDGSDDYGFSALPGGYYNPTFVTYGDGTKVVFHSEGSHGEWWTASKFGENAASIRVLSAYDNQMHNYGGRRSDAYSVRCVEN